MRFLFVVVVTLSVALPMLAADYCSDPKSCGVGGTIPLTVVEVPPGRQVIEIVPPEACHGYGVAGVTAWVCADDIAPSVDCEAGKTDRVVVTRNGLSMAKATIHMLYTCGSGWKPAPGQSADHSSMAPIGKKLS